MNILLDLQTHSFNINNYENIVLSSRNNEFFIFYNESIWLERTTKNNTLYFMPRNFNIRSYLSINNIQNDFIKIIVEQNEELLHEVLKRNNNFSEYLNHDYIELLLGMGKYWLDFLLNKKIDLVILKTVDSIDNYLIYLISKRLKIGMLHLILLPSFSMRHRYYVVMKDQFNSSELLSSKVLKTKQSLFDDYLRNVNEKQILIQNEVSFKARINSLMNSVSNINVSVRKFYRLLNGIITLINIRIHDLKLSSNYDKNCDFVYLPLHVDPEASTLPVAGDYRNLLFFLQKIRTIIPDSIPIIVKEHPSYMSSNRLIRQPIGRYRSKNFYAKILNTPNTIMLSSRVSSKELIKNSAIVASVNGSVVVEAFILNKLVLIGANSLYNYFPNTLLIDNIAKTQNLDKLYFERNQKVKKMKNGFEDHIKSKIISTKNGIIENMDDFNNMLKNYSL